MLIAPSEPAILRAIGTTSSLPEKYGVDILFPTPNGLAGIQRKEISDYIASIRDGRLGKELVQMQQLSFRALILEGKLSWTNQGQLMNGQVEWNKGQHYSSLMSVQDSNVVLLPTDSMGDTIALSQQVEKWLQKEKHSSFLQRPKPKGKWGKATNKDWACHLLQSFEGVALGTASAIYDHFDGHIPLAWTVTMEELMMVPGVGPKRAESLVKSLSTIDDLETET